MAPKRGCPKCGSTDLLCAKCGQETDALDGHNVECKNCEWKGFRLQLVAIEGSRESPLDGSPLASWDPKDIEGTHPFKAKR